MVANRLLNAIKEEKPLQIAGAINAYSAMLAKQAGMKAIYLSGAGVANASHGLPDLGMTNLSDVVTDASRITQAVDLPLLVDIDTGWGHAFNIQRAIRELERAGVSGVHIEDQVLAKRCGHRPNKAIVPVEEMVSRIKAAVDARQSESITVMARSDAFAQEGMSAMIDRAHAYIEAGAEMFFPEALTTLDEYQTFIGAVDVPVLANITEFGKTPLFTVKELGSVGVSMALYPLTAFRMMSEAARKAYQTLREAGTQQSLTDEMQTRASLYETLDYHRYEAVIDNLNKGEAS